MQAGGMCVNFDSDGVAASVDRFVVATFIDRFGVADNGNDAVLAGPGLGCDGLSTGEYRNSLGYGIRPSRVAGQRRKGHDDQRWYRRPADLRHG